MSASSAAREGRRIAESMMLDTVRITRRGDPVLSEVTGEVEHEVETLYEGRGRLVMRSAAVSEGDAAGQVVAVQRPRLDVPVSGTAGVREGDEFEVLASVTDSGLVGLSGVVAGIHPQTLATARRLPVEVVA